MRTANEPAEALIVPPDRSEAGRARLVVIIGALSAFGPLSIDMYLPALPALPHEFGGNASQAQLTLTACLLGLAVGQVIAGPLSDRLGRRRPLLAGVLLYALASLLCAAAPTLPALIACRLLQGLAGAAGVVIARAVVRDLFSGAEVARFFALTMLVNGLAPILAPIIGAQMLTFTSWRGVFVLLALIGVGLLALAAWGLRESLPAEQRRTGGIADTLSTFRALLTNRVFVGYALASGLAFAAMFTYISGSPFVLQSIYGVSPQLFSFIFGTNALGIVAASQVSGRLAGRVGPRRLLAIGLGYAALGGLLLLAIVLLGGGLAGILFGLFLVVSSIGLISPNATALAMAEQRRTAGSASALLGVLQFIAGAAIAPLAGIGGAATALPMALIMACLPLAALAAFLLLARPQAEAGAAAA
ncbi:Bcr/CflA family multidrug efflux MFS transporter [Kouleothrix sp.]|uniref:Bcr/CflA family multidrug efflux MFS transporter n=1 Tax=Kouleothrix sp. TaxID=2779161 RepID=UPI00391D851D